ncbi:hypothetical protein KJA17_02610, partial [Patescibacteria group bacterium]|nr:hypothetical protein [Patescibacteria group bacterium]
HVINSLMEQCDIALLAGCGFGKFSASEEEIRKAQEQLCENVETIYLPLPEGAMELKIFAFDSNNNPKHRLLVDGLWEPYRAIGLVKFKNIILAFQTTMDYGSGNWKLDRIDTKFLPELAKKSSLFKSAYQKIAEKEFDETEIPEVNPEFIGFLKASSHFQQALNRVCSRWTR